MATKSVTVKRGARAFGRKRGQRGAAFAEAVIMLPVFAIVFFGVMYIKDATVIAQTNLSKVRRCAWQYSNDACESDLSKIDPVCKAGLQNSNTPDTLFRTDRPDNTSEDGTATDPSLRSKVDEYNENASKSGDDEAGLGATLRKAVLGLLEVVGDLFENDKADVSASQQLISGQTLGNRRATIGVGYRISCNVKPKTLGEVFLDFLDAVNPF